MDHSISKPTGRGRPTLYPGMRPLRQNHPPAVLALIKKLAAETGLSQVEVVRRALQEFAERRLKR